MRAMQARLSANEYADTVEGLFEVDYDLEEWYHGLLDGMCCSAFFSVGGGVHGWTDGVLGWVREMGPDDGADAYGLQLLAGAHTEHVSSTSFHIGMLHPAQYIIMYDSGCPQS